MKVGCPLGYDNFEALVGPWDVTYYNPAFSVNCGPVVQYPGQYVTDLMANKSLAYIRDGVKSGKPYFLEISTVCTVCWFR